MQFAKPLRELVRSGQVTQSVRIWKAPRVKVGNRYALAPGHIVVEKLHEIGMDDITPAMARKTGFSGVVELLKIAKHGKGEKVYLVSFRYEAGG